MAYKIRFKREALKQLDAIYQYVVDKSPKSGKRILESVHVVFGRLGMFPFLGRPTDENPVRCLVVGSTGLLIFYIFDTETITIIRILHERQDRT